MHSGFPITVVQLSISGSEPHIYYHIVSLESNVVRFDFHFSRLSSPIVPAHTEHEEDEKKKEKTVRKQ